MTEELNGAGETIRDEEVIVVGQHDERRRHARQRVGRLRVVVGIGAIDRIPDQLDTETGGACLLHQRRCGVVGAAVGDQDPERKPGGRREGKPALREGRAVLQGQQNGQFWRAALTGAAKRDWGPMAGDRQRGKGLQDVEAPIRIALRDLGQGRRDRAFCTGASSPHYRARRCRPPAGSPAGPCATTDRRRDGRYRRYSRHRRQIVTKS